MGAIKITKVIDYTGDYYIFFGDGKSWYGIWCLSVQETSLAVDMLSHGYQAHSPKLTESARWSFLLFQDRVSLACSFPPSVPCSMPGSNCCFLTCIQVLHMYGEKPYRLGGVLSKVVWYSHLFNNFPQFVLIHTVKCFSIVSVAVDSFLEFPCFFYDPVGVGNLSLVPCLFIKF